MNKIKANIEVLSKSEIELIHAKSLKVLSDIGIKAPNDELLEICAAAGCNVDMTTKVMKIPAALMEGVLTKVKNEKLINEYTVQKLTGDISTQVFLTDLITKKRRYGMLDDVLKGIILTESLNYINSANSVVIPSDVPKAMAEIESFRTIYSYSTKPGGTYILTKFAARHILQMADVMGITHNYLLETISPLQFMEESLEIAMLYAKTGHGLECAPMSMAGASAPVTLAGTMVIENAEVLGTLLIIHTLRKAFTRHVAPAHSMDMQTMLCSFGSPNQALLGAAMAQMARYYGLTARTNTGLSDAIRPDFQCGFEKAATTIISHLTGSHEIGCQGIVGADQGFSFEQLLIDNEWLSYYNYILNGLEVNEDTIGFDIIEKVGIGGHFLSEDHTMQHMHNNYWASDLFLRNTWDNWLANGSADILQHANEIVQNRLKDYTSYQPVIPQGKLDDLNRIVSDARKESEKNN
jgi:trimethylamine--corrinoid protein Co-methyltransferase